MLPEFKITQLRHFVWVAELRGFHAAAEKAHRTQPAISLSIRDLEAKLGQSLFEKRASKTNRTDLTPFGEQFLPRAKELIAFHDRLSEDMTMISSNRLGHLRIGSVPSIASQVLPSMLKAFFVTNKGLNLSLYDGNTDVILGMVDAQEIDFGICHIYNENQLLGKRFTPIWRDQIGMVCPKDHELASKSSVSWRELLPYRFIDNGSTRLLEEGVAQPLLSASELYVSNMISLTAMLESGFGITLLPEYAFAADNEALCFVPLNDPKVVRRIGIVESTNTSLAPAAALFKQFVIDSAGTGKA